jgi:hypothetical protein
MGILLIPELRDKITKKTVLQTDLFINDDLKQYTATYNVMNVLGLQSVYRV